MKNKNNEEETVREDRERNDALNKSGREKEDKDDKLPGEYPPQEDIMNRRDTQRLSIDEQNFSRTLGQENVNMPGEPIVSDPNGILEEPSLGPALEGELDDLELPAAKEMEKPVPKDLNLDEDDMEFATGNESDVTKEDLEALGPKDLSMDMGEDEQILKNRVWPVDMAGADLDIPGAESAGDVEDEAIGPEDEENDFYSLGGDRHEDQMEGK